MTALLLHIIWSITYLIVFLIFNIIILFFFKNKINKINNFYNNYFIKLILITFFNKNLLFFKNLLSRDEIKLIEIERLKNWPTLNFIHSNINKLSKNNLDNNLNFKQNYKLYTFINNNLNLNNLTDNSNNKISYSIILNIIKNNFKNTDINSLNDLIILLLISKNSISENKIKIKTYNLVKFNDYINYVNETNINNNFNKTQLVLNEKNVNISKNLNLNSYNKYLNLNNMLNIKNNYFYLNVFNKYLNLNVEFNNLFLNNIKQNFLINFSASNIVKYISDYSVNNSVILYLRKNKIFNKSRYSRNRQTYRTGAYWCLYINIIAVVAFYFWFYKFTMNFGYLWWLLYIFILSFFLSRSMKYRFYNPKNLIIEFNLGFKWLVSIILVIFNSLYNILNNILSLLYLNIITKLYQINNFNKLSKKININLLYLQQSFNWIFNINKFILNYINKFII
uniref:Ymf67 n=1 Tax=Tetrahymena pigmentosa TaxID=5907 RepID=Q09F03_TETPI|nr:Ymf67 [Tetrahymena pigmentosa]ABI51748.1 Ymf67 [Tetrahymena pigmentosa]